MDVLAEMIGTFRRSTVLLAAENCGLRKTLLHGYPKPEVPNSTSDRVVLAAVALKMVDELTFQWAEPYRSIAKQDSLWRRLLALIQHQRTYLRLASSVNSNNAITGISPLEQLKNSPGEYLSFLQGVDASHWEHAKWFAQHSAFAKCAHLIDLGGGLGTFSRAWVESSARRRATVVDFPGVERLSTFDDYFGDNVTFLGGDLRKLSFLPVGDVYLFANVLHLLRDWQTVLATIVDLISRPTYPLVCVIEADPHNEAGRLFDLQVHLRSGGSTGLIEPSELASKMKKLPLTRLKNYEFRDENDPFKRDYRLWIGTVNPA